MSAGQAVHHPRLGFGQVLEVRAALAVVRFVKGVNLVPTCSLNTVRSYG